MIRCPAGSRYAAPSFRATAEYETVYQYNDKKPEGYEQVVQEGRDGVRREVYEIIYQI